MPRCAAGGRLRRWSCLLALAALVAAHSSLRIDRLEPDRGGRTGLGRPDATPSSRYRRPHPPLELAPADPWTVPGWLVAGRDRARRPRRAGRARPAGPPAGPRPGPPARRPKMPPGAEPASAAQTAEEVVAALDAGLVDLSDTDTDPRRAVIACWVRLEQAAAAAGMPRQIGDSPDRPGDPAARRRTGWSAPTCWPRSPRSTARRGTPPTRVDERMRAQARSALERLRAELTAGVALRERTYRRASTTCSAPVNRTVRGGTGGAGRPATFPAGLVDPDRAHRRRVDRRHRGRPPDVRARHLRTVRRSPAALALLLLRRVTRSGGARRRGVRVRPRARPRRRRHVQLRRPRRAARRGRPVGEQLIWSAARRRRYADGVHPRPRRAGRRAAAPAARAHPGRRPGPGPGAARRAALEVPRQPAEADAPAA